MPFMRNGSLDLVRLPAAFGVVLFHIHAPGAELGYSGLAYFLVLVPALGLPSSALASRAGFMRARARRLLLPWVIWSAIFVLLGVLLWGITQQPLAEIFYPWMIVTGAALHLWFLPYAFLASLCLPTLRRWVVGLSRPAFALPLAACLLLLLASFAPVLHSASDPPLAQWAFGLPSLLAGLVWGLVCLRGGNPWPAGLTVLAVIGLAAILGWQDGVLQLAIGFGAVLACTALPLPGSPLTAFCARHSMGVYLVHPLCTSALVRLLPLDHHGPAMAVAVMLASLGVSVLLGRTGPTRVLIGDTG